MLFDAGMMTKNPVEQAIDIAGSEAKLGALTGYSQVAINKAKRRGRASPRMALAIERSLNRRVTREQLCPEIFVELETCESAA